MRLGVMVCIWLLVGFGGHANEPPEAVRAQGMTMARFPQPVRVGDLAGRRLIGPSESQPLIGHVVGVGRREGGPVLLARVGGVLGRIGSHVVALPLATLALLGEHVVLLGLTAAQAADLPADPGGALLLPEEHVSLPLIGPFH